MANILISAEEVKELQLAVVRDSQDFDGCCIGLFPQTYALVKKIASQNGQHGYVRWIQDTNLIEII